MRNQACQAALIHEEVRLVFISVKMSKLDFIEGNQYSIHLLALIQNQDQGHSLAMVILTLLVYLPLIKGKSYIKY